MKRSQHCLTLKDSPHLANYVVRGRATSTPVYVYLPFERGYAFPNPFESLFAGQCRKNLLPQMGSITARQFFTEKTGNLISFPWAAEDTFISHTQCDANGVKVFQERNCMLAGDAEKVTKFCGRDLLFFR